MVDALILQSRQSNPSYKIMVAAPGHLKEITHERYQVLIPVMIDYVVFYLRPHILSVD